MSTQGESGGDEGNSEGDVSVAEGGKPTSSTPFVVSLFIYELTSNYTPGLN